MTVQPTLSVAGKEDTMAGFGAGIVRLTAFLLVAFVGVIAGVIAAAAAGSTWPQRIGIAIAVPLGVVALAYAVDRVARRAP